MPKRGATLHYLREYTLYDQTGVLTYLNLKFCLLEPLLQEYTRDRR